MAKKLTYLEFLEKSNEKFGRLYTFPLIQEEFKNNRSKLTIKCERCGNIFQKTGRDYLSSQNGGCKCYRRETISYTELCEKTKIGKNDRILPFDGLKSVYNDVVEVECKIHGIRKNRISSLIDGNARCNACYMSENSARRISKKEIQQRLEVLTKDSTIHPLLKSYKSTMESMLFVCDVCGTIFPRTVNMLTTTHNNTCPNCNKLITDQCRCKTTDEFISEAIKRYGDKFDYTNVRYTKSSEPVLIKCNTCDRTFSIEANSFLRRGICPYHNLNSSGDEREINQFISELGFETITNDRKILEGKEIDIFVPEKGIAFEYDGLFWHSEKRKDNDYNLNKTLEAEKHNIRMIHIFEDEWKHNKEICKSRIRNILGVVSERIYARKCQIRNVDTKTAKEFLICNHIQGYCHSQIRLGLFYNDELVSLMTFGKTRHFIGNSSHQYELLRFCNKLNTNIVGGASKLFKHFTEIYKPNNIVSYADRRWSIGNLYHVLGFNLYNISRPNYFYVIGYERKNRFNFRKSILIEKYNCPEDKSEREFCLEQGWYRIYDCGCYCFEWKKED